MTHEETVRTLLWAAGLDDAARPTRPADEAAFLDAVRRHRIAGRLLNRAEAGPPARRPPLPLDAVHRLYTRNMSDADDQRADLAWLAAAIAADPDRDGRPVIVIKGNSASHFLRGPRVRRRTWDLDLMVSDPPRYEKILTRCGYRATGANFPHEAACLNLPGRTSVDLHRYFPVWRYPEAPYRAVEAGGALRMTDWVSSGRLDYGTVLAGSVAHPEVAGLRMPDLTMTAFIMCLHIFHDFVAPALSQPLAKVRLIELCELRDLCHHDGFDVARFRDLVETHRAHDAVGLARRLLGEAGAPPGALAAVEVPPRRSYPQEIGFGLLVEPDTPLADLLVRGDTFGRIPELLGGTDVAVPTAPHVAGGPDRPWRGTTRDLPSVLRSTPAAHPGADFDFGLEVSGVDDAVRLEMAAAGGPGAFFDEFVLFFGNEIVHAAYDGYRRAFRDPPPESGCRARWRIGADGWTVDVRVPTETFVRHRTADGTVPAIVQGGRFVEPLNDSWDDFYRRSVSSSCMALRFHVRPPGQP
jgi:hypothetical protein